MPDAVLLREPEITDALVAAHGLKPDEYQRILDLIGRVPSLTELGIFSAMWNEHCSYKSLEEVAAHAADHRAAGDLRAGRERRASSTSATAEAGRWRWSSRWRATTTPPTSSPTRGRRPGSAGILRDVFTMGARPIAAMNALSLRRAVASEDAEPRARRRRRASAATATPSGCRRSGASCASTPPTTATASSTPSRPASPRRTASSTRRRAGVGMPVVYLGAKTGRDGVGGATMASRRVRRHHRGEAADGAGRRPLHREAADGGLPRADGDGRGDLDPGHGRGRPHLLGGRDGRQGRPRDQARPRPGAGARDRDDRLRDDAVARARSGC